MIVGGYRSAGGRHLALSGVRPRRLLAVLAARRGGPPTLLPAAWPSVTVVIPARNEADGIAETIGSLLRQDYAGAVQIILVDDDSSDGTADVARQARGGG